MSFDLSYYLLTSYRRKLVDRDLAKYSHLFRGNVLDIGGGKKDGKFFLPKTKKWIIADIDKRSNPDVLANVENLPFKNSSFDVIKATELFEHVNNFEKGFEECVRVLKRKGIFIVSSPFLFPLHPDPFDYQRIGRQKWEHLAKINGLKIKKIVEQGYFFTLLAETIRAAIVNIPFFSIRYLLYFSFPLLDLLTLLDSSLQKSKFVRNYTCGYFIIFQK